MHGRWLGKCPDCGAWDALEEHAQPSPPPQSRAGWESAASTSAPQAVPIAEALAGDAAGARIPTGMTEIDRVLGGSPDGARSNGSPAGLVPGSAVLIGGEPGIGKSTLLLQAAAAWCAHDTRPVRDATPAGETAGAGESCSVLYVTAEESPEQIASRAQRLGVDTAAGLYILADTSLPRITERARALDPAVIVIDSIQMIEDPGAESAPGSIAQLRRSASALITHAKLSGAAVVLVGHVTKDGRLAGPRVLEHLVDAVLSFEGDRFHAGRVLRALKNRYGTTAEVGLFHMSGAGLVESHGGATAESAAEPGPGSVVCPALHGSRCMLVEVQALTATGFLGAAKRKSSGLDAGRLAMIIAVLEQHAGLRLADRDIFASAVGGVKVIEPAIDLPLLLAIAGAHHRRALPPRTAVVGEVGLGGEVRPVAGMEARAQEAARMGFRTLIAPSPAAGGEDFLGTSGLSIDRVATIGQAVERLRAPAALDPTVAADG